MDEPITVKTMVLFAVGWAIGAVLPIAIWELSDWWKKRRNK